MWLSKCANRRGAKSDRSPHSTLLALLAPPHLLDFRWDEKADPPRSTLCCVGLQTYASSMWAQNGRRIGL